MNTRIITGLLITTGLILLCLFAPVWLVYGVLQVAAALGMYEIVSMARAPYIDRVGTFTAGVALTALAFFAPQALPAAVMILPVVVLGAFLVHPKPIETVAPRMATSLTAVSYVGVLFAALIHLSTRVAGEDSPKLLLLLGAIVFLSDTGAYFVGKYLGRHKLYPLVSPKKTVEGALGGIGGAVLGAIIFKLFVASGVSWLDIVATAVPCSILGQIGDLTESLFKRSYGVKDSGSILPGHGGILDRFDGILFAAPYLLLYAMVAPISLS